MLIATLEGLKKEVTFEVMCMYVCRIRFVGVFS